MGEPRPHAIGADLPSDSSDAPVVVAGPDPAGRRMCALITAVIIGVIFRRLGRRWPVAVEASRRGRMPFRLLLVLIAARQVIASTTVLGGWQDTLITILQLAILAVCGWLLAILAFALEDLTLSRFRMDVADNRRARRVRTQVLTAAPADRGRDRHPGDRRDPAHLARRPGGGRDHPGVRRAHLASSPASPPSRSLANVFAGLQLAFTDAIRVDDVVVVETEWGRIEEITLTYVVVHIWDDRRLIMPSTYFTTTPFQNWTRKESACWAPWSSTSTGGCRSPNCAPNSTGAAGDRHLGRTGRHPAGHRRRRQLRPDPGAGLGASTARRCSTCDARCGRRWSVPATPAPGGAAQDPGGGRPAGGAEPVGVR